MIGAVLGPSGTFSEEAASNYWSQDIKLEVASSINELFFLLENEKISDILIPIENTQAGTIEASMINLVNNEVSIQGEIYMPIRQHLLGVKPYKLQEIELLVSQLAVYAQCNNYINKYLSGARTEIATSTTKAVQIVKNETKKAAAIANYKAAELYDLHIIEEDIQNNNNITRFIHVNRHKPKLVEADKASLIFSLPDYPGSLSETLKLFAKHSLNLTKIVSSPDPKATEKYSFYIDVDVKGKIKNLEKVLEELVSNSVIVKYLGSYNSMVK